MTMAKRDQSNETGKSTVSSEREKVVDKGYAVVVLIAAFLLNILVEAAFSGMSVLVVEWKHDSRFKGEEQSIIWVGGILMSIGFIFSFIVGWLVKRFGCRRIGIISSLLISISFMASSFATSITHLYITYGVMLGLFITCFFNISSIAVQQYFEKYRAVAQGTLMAGLSAGTFMWPPLTRLLIDQFGWRGALRFVSAVELHGIALCMLIRPLPPPVDESKKDAYAVEETDKVVVSHSTAPLTEEARPNKIRGGSCFKAMFKTLVIFPHYMLYMLALIMTQSGNVLPYTLVPMLADSLGIEKYRCAMLVSIGATSSGIGRVLAGILGNHPKVNRILMCGISGLVAGTLTTVTAELETFYQLAIIFAVIGLPSASLMSGYASAAVDIVGKKYVQQGVGLMSVGFGFAHFFCFLFTGFLADQKNGIAKGFFIFGVVEAIGGILFMVVFFLDRRVKQRHDNKQIVEVATSDNVASPAPLINDSGTHL